MKLKNLLASTALGCFLAACSCGNKLPQSDLMGKDTISSSSFETVDSTNLDSGNFFKGRVSDRVFFATNSSGLNQESQDTLREQASMLKGRSHSLVVEGHCDERGTREYNLALGERRANQAKEELCKNGVDCSKVTTVSYGKERPEVMGNTPEAWAQNRRAVTVVQN